MHDAEAVVLALHIAKVVGPAMIDERVHERPIGMVDGRMAHEPYLLGQHDKVVVLEADVKVDWLSRYRARLDLFLFLVHMTSPAATAYFLTTLAPFTKTLPDSIARAAALRLAKHARAARSESKPLPRIKRRSGITEHTRHLFSTPVFAPTRRALRLGALMDEKRHDK